KLATMVFCDVSGSTALAERVDAEAVQALMQRYFREMQAVLERHGGTVQKFIGDAGGGGFWGAGGRGGGGVRACRAALGGEGGPGGLGAGIGVRIGVNSGEVIAADNETLVTGDAVNVAARLEQAASPGEVLVGEQTCRLARGAVRVEALEPVAAKGKSAPV